MAATTAAPQLRTLPDYLRSGLRLVFVGTNPGELSARAGHYYARKSNHFWPLLREAGFVPASFSCEDDASVLEHGIGLTDLCKRPTAGVNGLSCDEMAAGAVALRTKLRRFRPRVVCFNGKAAFEGYAGRRCDFGLQLERVEGALAFVVPSTSPRVTAYTRAGRLPYFIELKRLVEQEALR